MKKARVIAIDRKTGRKLRQLTPEQLREAESIFKARMEARRLEAGSKDEARVIPAHVKGPARLNEPFAGL